MRVICNLFKPFSRSFSAFMTVLLCLSGLGTFTATLKAQTTVNFSQVSQLGTFPNGGVLSSGSLYAGTGMVVNQQGLIIAAEPNGQDVIEFDPTTGVSTIIGPGFTNAGSVAIDAQNNLYISTLYDEGADIVKVPFIKGAYVAITAPTGNTPACVGGDKVECYLQNLTDSNDGYYIQVRGMALDAAGDIFIGTAEGEIVECTVACLNTGNPGAVVLYTEPAKTSSNDQYLAGQLAVDANGNLFFTDSDTFSSNNTSYSYMSNLKELVYTSGTGYAATPVLLYSYTPANPGSGPESDEIIGVATANNTVYFTTLYDGMFAFTDTAGVVTPTIPYAVSLQGGEVLATNGTGQFYVDSRSASGSENLVQIGIGTIAVPPIATGATSSTITNGTVILNDGTCAAPETVTFATTGTNAGDFLASAGTTCTSTLTGGEAFPLTVTFTPSGTVNETATLTGTDTAGNSGSAALTGAITPTLPPTFSLAAGSYTGTQTVTITSATPNATIYYTTDGVTTPTQASASVASGGTITVGTTETVMAVAQASGLGLSPVASAVYFINVSFAATPTITPAAGTYATAQTVTITSTTPGATIYYTTDGVTVPNIGSPTIANGGTIMVAASETVMASAIAPGYSYSPVATSVYTIGVPSLNFSIAINPAALSVNYGGSGTVSVSATPLDTLSTPVTFACSGLPTGTTCTFAPASLTFSGGSSVSTVLTITPPATFAALHPASFPFLPGGTIAAAALCMIGLRKRHRLRLALMLMLGVVATGLVTGCSGGGSSKLSSTFTATDATSTVTVSATSGAITSTSTFSLTVQ